MSQESFFSDSDYIDIGDAIHLIENFDFKKTRCNCFILNKNRIKDQVDL